MTASIGSDAPPAAPSTQDREFTIKARSQRQQIVRRFVQNKPAMLGLIIFVLLLLLALIGPLLNKFKETDLDPHFDAATASPGTNGHLLGQADSGRDLLILIENGTQRSLLIAVVVMALAGVIGVLYGAVSGYFGGGLDTAMMRVVDFFLVVPSLIVLAVLVNAYPHARQYWAIGVFLALFGWFDLARLVRGSFLSLREREFIEAAHSIGTSNARIIFKHMIPNAIGTIVVWITLAGATAVIGEATLSYLGLGPSGYSLGRLVSDGVNAADTRPWLFYFPGITMVLIVLSINLIGDGIRDAVDPSNTKVRA